MIECDRFGVIPGHDDATAELGDVVKFLGKAVGQADAAVGSPESGNHSGV